MLSRTTSALLDDLADAENQSAWRDFDARYRPVLVGFARKLGLNTEDAADAAQDTLIKFVKSYRAGKYDRDRGRLSSWVIGIARHCILDIQKKQASRREARGMSAIAGLPADDRLAEIWEEEQDKEILQQATNALHRETNLEEKTIRAFELVAFEQVAPPEVATQLGVSVNEVYLAKHRVLKQIRGIVAKLTTAYESDR